MEEKIVTVGKYNKPEEWVRYEAQWGWQLISSTPMRGKFGTEGFKLKFARSRQMPGYREIVRLEADHRFNEGKHLVKNQLDVMDINRGDDESFSRAKRNIIVVALVGVIMAGILQWFSQTACTVMELITVAAVVLVIIKRIREKRDFDYVRRAIMDPMPQGGFQRRKWKRRLSVHGC